MTGQRDDDRSGPEDREGQKITEQRDDGRLQRRQSRADNDRSGGGGGGVALQRKQSRAEDNRTE